MADRNTHLRTSDHSGSAPLSDFVLSADIDGRYPTLPTYTAGTPVADVLNDIITRLAGVTITRLPQFTLDAVLQRTIGNDTALSHSGTPVYLAFYLDAMIFDPAQSFTLDAVIV